MSGRAVVCLFLFTDGSVSGLDSGSDAQCAVCTDAHHSVPASVKEESWVGNGWPAEPTNWAPSSSGMLSPISLPSLEECSEGSGTSSGDDVDWENEGMRLSLFMSVAEYEDDSEGSSLNPIVVC